MANSQPLAAEWEAMSDRRRRRTGSRLFVMYAAASLVPVSVLGGVLVHDYQDGGLEHGRDQGR